MKVWLKYLSYKKITNLLKVYFGYFLSIIFKKVIIWGYPYSLTTEPTNKCNLNCLECPTGNKNSSRPYGMQDASLYKKIIDEVKQFTIYQMLYFQGEPLLNSQLFEFISYADQNKIYTCTSTNGHFLTKNNCEKLIQSGLKKIIISLDGTNQESYQKYRVGGDFDKVVNGIKTLICSKKQLKAKFPLINLQFLVFNHNQHQIKEIKKLSKILGVDKLELKSAQIENMNRNSHLIPRIKKYSRYLYKFPYSIKTNLPNRCFRIWETAVISWDGTLVPCCFDKSLTFKLGNLYTKPLKDLWKSPEFNVFRKKILLSRKKSAICRNCSEGLRIKY